jgi:F0F1-type ATP synthase assembly protein I
MDKDERNLLVTLANAGSTGFTMVLSTFSGLGLGLLIDKLTGLKPLFTIVFLLLGIIMAFVWVIYKFGVKK